jgi:hypothetical protein
MEVAALFAIFVGALVLGLPMAVSLGLSSLVYILLSGLPPVAMPRKIYAGTDVLCCCRSPASSLPAT